MSDIYYLYPILIVGGVVGLISTLFIVAYAMMRDKKAAVGFERNMKDGEILRRMLRYARPHLGKFALVGITVLISVAYDVISPLLIGYIEQMVSDSFELAGLFAMVGVYASILAVSLLATYLQAIILQQIGQKMLSEIREDTFQHIEGFSHAQMNSIPVGKLVTRVTNDTGAISMMFTGVLVELVKNSFVIIGVLTAMLCLNYALTLMVLCFVPFVVLFTFIFRRFSRRAYRRVKDKTTDINTYLSENLSGMKITQTFNKERRKMQEFSERNTALGAAKRHEIFVFGIFRPMVFMLYNFSVLCLFYLGCRGVIGEWEILGQTVSSSVMVSFYMFINKFFNPIQSLADQFNRLQSAFASAEKIFSIMDIEPEVVDAEDALELTRVEGNIEFRNVWFAYKEGEWVLRDVSFTIGAGQTVAFVGATGSGKSTILSLLVRNYEIQRGEILVDGINIRNIKIASLRRHFGQMLQDVFLFSGTVRSNILLGLEGVGDDEVMEACRYVNADRFISAMPAGLDEQIRERGNNLSVGQRQLLSFARTLIHHPSVMILDEATANIDTETESLIQDSLQKLMSRGTMLVVAHRLSTIQHADNIIVLSAGQIAEQGSHAQLLALGGKYHALYMIQYEKDKRTLGGLSTKP